MKVRARGNFADEKIELQMTPMIDIVFQLLVFFIMTFKIAAMEGDFNIKMPLSAPSEGSPEEREMPPFQRMAANPDGSLRSMRLDQQTLGANIGSPEHAAQAFVGLRQEIVTRVGDASGPGSVRETASVKLDCDYNLKYEYVIAAITAVSGYIKPGASRDQDAVVKLIEKIEFSPPQKAPGG